MPSRTIVRAFEPNAFYHVYNRGAGEQKIFTDSEDKRTFLNLFRRHLLEDIDTNTERYMGNHFHLLLWQNGDDEAITDLMHSVSIAYSMYFNRRHKRQGHVFQSAFKASHVSNDSYLVHITRYIHLNPERYRHYYWSSLKEYLGERNDELVHPGRVLDVTPERYLEFLEDYTDRRLVLSEIKDMLANK